MNNSQEAGSEERVKLLGHRDRLIYHQYDFIPRAFHKDAVYIDPPTGSYENYDNG
jgi:hypothetical protein